MAGFSATGGGEAVGFLSAGCRQFGPGVGSNKKLALRKSRHFFSRSQSEGNRVSDDDEYIEFSDDLPRSQPPPNRQFFNSNPSFVGIVRLFGRRLTSIVSKSMSKCVNRWSFIRPSVTG
jgi:hypothetical protein